MKSINCFLRPPLAQRAARQLRQQLQHTAPIPKTCRRRFSRTASRRAREPADDPNFSSIIDAAPQLVRSGRKHGPGLILLGRQAGRLSPSSTAQRG